jgi:hypothetical protein
MGVFTKMSNGWQLGISSFKVLNANKGLMLFPIMSGLSMLMIFGLSGYLLYTGGDSVIDSIEPGSVWFYALILVFYLVNYFVVVFFNMALIHCATLYYNGEDVSISKGLKFSVSRLRVILSWALFAATVGTVLQIIQDNVGWLGKFITGLIDIVWGVATFLVVPVLAYENAGPVEAVKRSAQLMKQKWGEGIGASFSFVLLLFPFFIVFAIVSYGVGFYTDEMVGIAAFVLSMGLLFVISSTLQSIVISALYANINGNMNEHFQQKAIDGLFESKE